MKNKSISFKIFIVFIMFTISIFLFIGIFTKLLLPKYYVGKQMKSIEKYTALVRKEYDENNINKILEYFDQLKNNAGGDIYLMDDTGNIKGAGRLKNSQGYYNITEDIFETRFLNKYNFEIYSFGVKINNEYLVYEVSIQSLGEAVNVMMEFFVALLLLSLIIAIIVAYFISMHITKPIKKINELARQMKDKKVSALIISNSSDEIGQLNKSINLMYEELLSNIQRLESELTKERTVEKMKKQFLAQATHELKTPLAVISGYAELVNENIYKDDTERDYYIQNIYNETEKMNKLIMDILDYSKIESGFFTVNKEQVFVNPWINNIIGTFKNIIENAGVEFIVNNKVGDLCINMDAFRMEQVVKNLLSNAIEHSNEKVILNAYNLNEELAIEVINTGNHIEEEDLPYIFDSFYKKKGKKTGTGLGLAIVKGIIELHSGDYRVENIEAGVKFLIIVG